MTREEWLETQYRLCREIMPPAPVSREEGIALYELLAHELDAAMIQVVPDSAGAARGGRTGYAEAGIVDRLNRVLGPGGWMDVTRVREAAVVGQRRFVLVDLLLWVPCLSRFVDAVGFGKGADMGDAEKGAITTAMKRAARKLGPGWQAYAGLVDPDLAPKDEF